MHRLSQEIAENGDLTRFPGIGGWKPLPLRACCAVPIIAKRAMSGAPAPVSRQQGTCPVDLCFRSQTSASRGV